MTAEARTMTTHAAGALERETIPDDGYRSALMAVLVSQALPLWNVDQRDAYAEHTMDGPSLDHWVRTTNVWAELERRVWEFDHLAESAGLHDSHAEVATCWRATADRVEAAEQDWLGLVFSMCYLDGVGHALVQACHASTYGPLLRTARLATNGKWGVVASGLVGLGEVVRLDQAPPAELAERRATWRELAAQMLTVAVAAQSAIGDRHGITDLVDAEATLAAVDARVAAILEVGR
jgi:hypothetical protein